MTPALPNPCDPRLRPLSPREALVLEFTDKVLHGDDLGMIDRVVSPAYIQHTPGIGQGREGLRRYILAVARKWPGRREWRPVRLFEAGDFVILHKHLRHVVIADFFRFDGAGMLAEHWDVVQPLPEPGYDPMRPSSEDFGRFAALFRIGEAD